MANFQFWGCWIISGSKSKIFTREIDFLSHWQNHGWSNSANFRKYWHFCLSCYCMLHVMRTCRFSLKLFLHQRLTIDLCKIKTHIVQDCPTLFPIQYCRITTTYMQGVKRRKQNNQQGFHSFPTNLFSSVIAICFQKLMQQLTSNKYQGLILICQYGSSFCRRASLLGLWNVLLRVQVAPR